MIKTNTELVAAVLNVAKNYKTLYVMGCFGAPLNAGNKQRYTQNHEYNRQATRTKMIKVASNDTFGFDCVCLIKSLLWGWNGDTSKSYGGANYASNGVPDISADGMIKVCKNVSTNFSNIQPGEAVWLPGHIGVYVGNGLVVECTPAFNNCVQVTACGNIGSKAGYNKRTWQKHGKLPYITYKQAAAPTQPEQKKEQKPASNGNYKVGDVVEFTGNKQYINANATEGKSCRPGKAKVTALANGKHPVHLVHTDSASNVYGWVDVADIKKGGKSVDKIAREVLQGKWGNGADRKKRIEAAGYNYAEVQAKVNELCR